MLTDHKRLTAGFFRSVNSAALFKEFFEKYNVWQKLGLKESPKNDDIYDAWALLDHPKREEMFEALCCMNDISREEGREYLVAIAREVKLKDFEDLTLPKMAMTLWLRHRRKFQQMHDCFMLEKADNLKVLIGRTRTAAPPDNINLSGFKDKLRRILRKDGEGPRLLTEVGPHPERKWVLVVPHEHFVKPDHVFKSENEIGTRERRPVHELVVVYHYDKGLLKIKVSGRGNRKAEAVASAFATEVLRKHGGHFQVVEIISFDPILRAGGFSFPKRPADHFDWASLVELRFKRLSDPTFTHGIKCNNTLGGKQDVLGQLKELGISPKDIRIESLAIQFQFPGGGKKKRRTVVLSAPNRYTLDETAKDRYLEDVLQRWGFINLDAKENADVAIAAEQAV
jgi:hypothetical protein